MRFSALLIQVIFAQLVFTAPAPIDNATGEVVKREPGTWCGAQRCSMDNPDRRDAEPVAPVDAERDPGTWCGAQRCSMDNPDRRDEVTVAKVD
ncbi:UNVERIFIED_CONTAM: hypothetical protein HDU68_000644, partial [Siphonaria sp. JEL0065]